MPTKTIIDKLERADSTFSQSRNDMYWKHWDSKDGYVRWIGYDDAYWWTNISVKPEWQTRTMESGTIYTLNPVTGTVFIARARSQGGE